MIAPATRGGWLLALCSMAPACTYLVEPEANDIKCLASEREPNPCPDSLVCIDQVCVEAPSCQTVDGQSTCPAELICRDGQCVDKGSCTPTADVCGDHIDNDCDGKTDEAPDLSGNEVCGDDIDNDCDGKTDEGHDVDGDGYTWCGDASIPNGGGPTADCKFNDSSINPGAAEACDNVDNDCDGRTDETSDNKSLCAAGETCIGRCVKPSCAIDGSVKCKSNEMCDVQTGKCVPRSCEDECEAGEFCDAQTGTCTSTKRPNGTACASHDECLSGSCIESEALRLTTSARRVCGQTCCSDSQCLAGERCFASGTGARSCLPVGSASLSPASEVACTDSAECKVGNACRFEADVSVTGSQVSSRSELTTSVCRPLPQGAIELGADCEDQSLCPSNECVSTSYGPLSRAVCTATCGTSEDCAPLAGVLGTSARVYCGFGIPLSDENRADDIASACLIASSSETGSGAAGASCRSGSDCLDGACVGAAGYTDGFCAPTCCNDSQCSEVNGLPTYCRPVAFGQHYETRCIP